eukprot:PITA_08275
MSSSKLTLGMSVEVRSNESRYSGAWLQGVIVAIYVPPGRAHRYKIRYQQEFQFLMDNGQRLTEDDVSYTQVRPIPPLLSETRSYSVGDIVEVYDDHCWWWGSVIKVFHAAQCFLIHNPQNSCYSKFPLSKLRHPLQWSKGSWSLLNSKHSSDVINDGNYCSVAENSEQSSVASCPGDMQSQEQPEEEVNTQKRPCGLVGTRVPQKTQECSNFLDAKRVVKDSRGSKSFGNGLKNVEARPMKGVKRPYVPDDRRHGTFSGLKNVEALSLSPARPSTRIKRPCVRDDRRDRTFSGIQSGKCDNVKRFTRGDSAEAMEQTIKTHDMELVAYRSVLKAFYAQNPSSLSLEYHCLLTDLRIPLDITSDENTRELKRVTSRS